MKNNVRSHTFKSATDKTPNQVNFHNLAHEWSPATTCIDIEPPFHRINCLSLSLITTPAQTKKKVEN